MKVLAAEGTGKEVGPEASLLKIKGTEIQQSISELLFEAIGNYAHPYVPEALEAGWNENPISFPSAWESLPTPSCGGALSARRKRVLTGEVREGSLESA